MSERITPLEGRYRRLLRVYPWEHRRAYEDEMLAVLLAGSRPGQRRPGLRDVADVLVAGLRARLRVTARGMTDPAWADGAAVTGLLTALALFGMSAHVLLDQFGPTSGLPMMPGGSAPRVDAVDWLRVAGWAAVCAAMLLGFRRLAAGLAWAAVVAAAVLLLPRFRDEPGYVADNLWQVALALTVAVALSVPVPRRRAAGLLGVRRLLLVGAALVLVETVLRINRMTDPGFATDSPMTVYGSYGLTARSEAVILLYQAGLAVAGIALLVAVATLPPPVRRRIAVYAAPVLALVAVVDGTLTGWATSTAHMGHPIPLVPAQWAALALAPPVAFLAGVLLVRRREERLRMLALGRAADRAQPAG